MNPRRTLIAGIGNIFLCDDAFGVETVNALAAAGSPPDGVVIRDFGIRSYDLAYAILEGFDTVILVDASPRGQPPGTLTLLELDPPAAAGPADPAPLQPDGHSLRPDSALRVAAAMGPLPPHLFLVACEPGQLDPDTDDTLGLSPAVRAAIPGAIDMIRSLLQSLQSQPQPASP